MFLSDIGDVYFWKSEEKEPHLLKSIEERVITDIASGLNHFLFLTFDGKVMSYGTGEYGQLVIINTYKKILFTFF